jgi:hypothetical protein
MQSIADRSFLSTLIISDAFRKQATENPNYAE